MAEPHPSTGQAVRAHGVLLGARRRAEQLQAEDVVNACGTNVSKRSTAALLTPSCTEQGALSHCLIVTLLSCCAVLTGFFLPPRCHTCTKASSPYGPSAPGRQTEKFLWDVFPAEAGSVIQVWPWPLFHQPCLTLRSDLVAADKKP